MATNGLSVSANENVTSAILQSSNLGRALAPGLAFQTVDLTLPGQVYPDRVNSLDLRLAKGDDPERLLDLAAEEVFKYSGGQNLAIYLSQPGTKGAKLARQRGAPPLPAKLAADDLALRDAIRRCWSTVSDGKSLRPWGT